MKQWKLKRYAQTNQQNTPFIHAISFVITYNERINQPSLCFRITQIPKIHTQFWSQQEEEKGGKKQFLLLPIQTIMYKQHTTKHLLPPLMRWYKYFKKDKACFFLPCSANVGWRGVQETYTSIYTLFTRVVSTRTTPIYYAQHQIYWHQLYKQHLAFCTGADAHVICSLHIKMEHQRTPNSDQAWTQRSTAPRGNGISIQSVEWNFWDMFRLAFT